MKNTPFEDLLARYLADDLSADELRQFMQGLQQQKHDPYLRSILEKALRERQFGHLSGEADPDAIFGNVLDAGAHVGRVIDMKGTETPVTPRSRILAPWRWAGAAVLVIAIGLGGYSLFHRTPVAGTTPQLSELHQSPASFIRYLVLPDGSTVVLEANSMLEYKSSATDATREVVLTGEAYFDIHHDPSRPFIIHTGAVKTTVLGTAFNVKSIPGTGQIVVSVAKGKVRVEDEKKIFAVLLPNQQVVYSTVSETVVKKEVNTHKIVTDWTTQDMVFESASMNEILKILSKRYGVTIAVRNPALQQCQVNISFSGTEALDDVLRALCTITNASIMEKDEKKILIDGEGCQ